MDTKTYTTGEAISKTRQIFKDIARKVSKAGKSTYVSALSSISISRLAGRTTVLKMEITSRKMKMQKIYTRLGEALFKLKGSDASDDIFRKVSIRSIVDELETCVKDIREIEQYMSTLKKTEEEKNTIKTGPQIASEKKENVKDLPCKAGKDNDLSAFGKLMKDKNTDVRVQALKDLFRIDKAEVIPYIVKGLKDKQEEVRRRAALYLGWRMAVSAAPPLMTVTRDKAPSVRKASFEALGEFGTREAIPTFLKGLDDPDSEVRKAAYKALTNTTNEFLEFDPDGSLSERFKGIQKWEKWWKSQKEKK